MLSWLVSHSFSAPRKRQSLRIPPPRLRSCHGRREHAKDERGIYQAEKEIDQEIFALLAHDAHEVGLETMDHEEQAACMTEQEKIEGAMAAIKANKITL